MCFNMKKLAFRTKFKLLWAALLVVVLAGAAGASYLIRANGNPRDQFPTVTARRTDIAVWVSGSGRLEAEERRELRAGVTAVVESTMVQEGAGVKSGDLVMRLSSSEVTARANEARTRLEEARSKLAEALDLPWQDAMTAKVGDVVEVKAPLSGRVVEVNVKAGDLVQSGAVLGKVVDDGHLILRVSVTKPEADALVPGQEVLVMPEGFSGQLDGRVVSVAKRGAAADAAILYDVLIRVANPGLLSAGYRATAVLGSAGGVSVQRSGVFEWPSESGLRAVAGGTVEDVMVRQGQRVERGEPLFFIRNEGLANRIAALRSAVEEAQVDLEKRQEDVGRLEVRSPIDGVVASLPVKAGDAVTSETLLAVITSVDSLQAQIAVDELDILLVKPGQQAVVKVDAFPGREFPATVSSIATEPEVEGEVATYKVKLSIRELSGPRPGMTATGSILVQKKEGVLAVPAEAVSEGARGSYVRVLDSRGQVVQRAVETGIRNDEMVEVLDGLAEGERVVVQAASSQQSVRTPGPPGFGIMGGGPARTPSRQAPGRSRSTGGGNR